MSKKGKHKLPNFSKMSEEEVANFWDTHDSADYWDEMEEVKEEIVDVRPKKAISMRIDERTLKQLKKTAAKKGLGHQTLIRMWVKERLEEEKRKKTGGQA